MNLHRLLIILIVADLILGNAQPILGIFGIETDITAFVPADQELPRVPPAVGTHLQLVYLVVLLLAYGALLKHRSIGRWLYLAAWVLSLVILSVAANSMSNRLGVACTMLTGLTGGLILGVVYLSPLADEFT